MDKHLSSQTATWALFDSSGNLIDSFDDEGSAQEALSEIVRADPANAEHVALIGYDAAGDPISAPPRGAPAV